MKQTLLQYCPMHRRTLPFTYQQKNAHALLPFPSALDLFSSGYDQTNLCSLRRRRQRRRSEASFSEEDEQRSPCCKPFVCTAAGPLRFKTGNPGWLPFKALSANVGFEKPVVSISKDSRDNSMAAAKVKRIWENFRLHSQVNRRHAEVQLISPVSWSLYSKAKANKNIVINKYIGNNT